MNRAMFMTFSFTLNFAFDFISSQGDQLALKSCAHRK